MIEVDLTKYYITTITTIPILLIWPRQLTGDFPKPSADLHSNVAPHKSINVPSCKTFVSSSIWKNNMDFYSQTFRKLKI